ncbi:MAG: hypothetical protein GY760_16980 [Deltaproteobacteria bacterium]|nr:hypothetical protein [Deltaproteobacteria bacterium]
MTEDLPSTPLHGQKILATAGTAEPIVGVSTPSKAIVITALEANSGYIYVGGSTVTSSNGYILPSGGSIGEIISDLQYMYIVSEKDGDGVCYLGS